jgi:hypothetical protein
MLNSTFRIFGQSGGSAQHPEDVLMGDELEGIVDGQDSASEWAGSSPSFSPR